MLLRDFVVCQASWRAREGYGHFVVEGCGGLLSIAEGWT